MCERVMRNRMAKLPPLVAAALTGTAFHIPAPKPSRPDLFKPYRGLVAAPRLSLAQRFSSLREHVAVFINFFKCAGDIVHVRAGTEEHALSQPDALLTNQVAVRTVRSGVVQTRGSGRQERPKGLVA